MKKLMLTFGIAIIFAIFFGYAAEVIFEPVKYNCEAPRVPKLEMDEQERQQIDDYYRSEEYQQCQDKHNEEREAQDFKSFILLTIIAILAIILSFILTKKEIVSSGILGGGILLLVYAVMRHWGLLNKYTRLSILGSALIILVYYTYKKVDKK
jgi:hypothetical protein